MQLHSVRTLQAKHSPEQQLLPYSSETLRQDLQRVRCAWEE
jgi:hypothetical protein